MAKAPIEISRWLADEVASLRFDPPTAYVYNPLVYARRPHEAYLSRYAIRGVENLLLGMNPGPWGMAQTGVPFGEVSLVRDFLGIESPVEQPGIEHPKRPIEGFACRRSEVSGRRLWGWARDRFGTAAAFRKQFFVANYCPLVFMEASARNRTPDKLPTAEREPLFAACDEALRRLVAWCRPRRVVGIGTFAANRAAAALADSGLPIGTILHRWVYRFRTIAAAKPPTAPAGSEELRQIFNWWRSPEPRSSGGRQLADRCWPGPGCLAASPADVPARSRPSSRSVRPARPDPAGTGGPVRQ
jgi:single-strand selective monofunctional uracil DNA glycosylase